VRGRTITQDKMLHDHHPLVDLLGQISGSNCWLNSLVEFVRRIPRSNRSVKLLGQIAGSNSLVELLDQIGRSNSWIKSMGQIGWSCNVRRYIRNVARYVKRSQSNAANPRPPACQPRRTHGRAYGWAENGLGWAGKRQRKSPRGETWGLACLAWLAIS